MPADAENSRFRQAGGALPGCEIRFIPPTSSRRPNTPWTSLNAELKGRSRHRPRQIGGGGTDRRAQLRESDPKRRTPLLETAGKPTVVDANWVFALLVGRKYQRRTSAVRIRLEPYSGRSAQVNRELDAPDGVPQHEERKSRSSSSYADDYRDRSSSICGDLMMMNRLAEQIGKELETEIRKRPRCFNAGREGRRRLTS